MIKDYKSNAKPAIIILTIIFTILNYFIVKIGGNASIVSKHSKAPIYASTACVIFGLLAFLIVYQQEKKMESIFFALSTWAENIASCNFSNGQNIYGEGALAVFLKQFSTMERSTQSIVNSLQKEKEHIKDFIANISHQLKTPLTTLHLYMEIISQDNKQSEIDSKILVCLTQVERMEWLVNTLLKIAKFDSHSIDLNFQKADLVKTVKYGVDLVISQANNKNINFELKGEKQMLIRHDTHWLAEAIENIVKNAIENIEDHGHIIVNIEQGEALAIVSIIDNGAGINSKDLPFIFNRFYTSRKSKARGIGIGLSLVKAIVNAHHGSVKAYSNDAGAKFIISLPIIDGKVSYENVSKFERKT